MYGKIDSWKGVEASAEGNMGEAPVAPVPPFPPVAPLPPVKPVGPEATYTRLESKLPSFIRGDPGILDKAMSSGHITFPYDTMKRHPKALVLTEFGSIGAR